MLIVRRTLLVRQARLLELVSTLVGGTEFFIGNDVPYTIKISIFSVAR